MKLEACWHFGHEHSIFILLKQILASHANSLRLP